MDRQQAKVVLMDQLAAASIDKKKSWQKENCIEALTMAIDSLRAWDRVFKQKEKVHRKVKDAKELSLTMIEKYNNYTDICAVYEEEIKHDNGNKREN